MDKTFIFQDIEVKMTGRMAKREQAKSGDSKSVMVEITPVNENDGTWKKWVFTSTLFRIFTSTNTDPKD